MQSPVCMALVKVRFLKNVLGKLVHPKIHKNCPDDSMDFNGAVFVIFWMNQFPKYVLKRNGLYCLIK